MFYSKLIDVYERLAATTKGLEKTEITAEFLVKARNEPEIVYLLQGKFFPDYDERESGVSEQLVIKAIAKAVAAGADEVVREFKKTGDLGKSAEILIGKKRQAVLFGKKLTTQKFLESLRKLPGLNGKGTVERKVSIIVELLTSGSPVEAKYIIRTLLGDLKVGIGSGILRDAIVECCFEPKDLDEKRKYGEIVQSAYDKTADFAEVFSRALSGLKNLESVDLSPGRPVKVMLYPKAKDIKEAFEIVGKPAAFEYKYDGFRMMINKDENGKISIFTRRLDNVSKQFPDAVAYARENVKAESFIIDCEAVGYNPLEKKYLPFESVSQRIKRKYDIEKMEKELPIELNVFDIIYFNGRSLLNEFFLERRKILEKIVKTAAWKIKLAQQIVTDSDAAAEKFYSQALKDGQEGLMAKNLNAIYKPGARVGYGVKIKPDPNEFDLVIVGAEYGTGKRAGWLTSYDVSCRDKDGNLMEVGKVSTGLKEKPEEGLSFVEMTNELKKIIVSEDGKHVNVKPKIVVSIGYQNIQKSPSYSSGYALRFPRVARLRPDRSVSDIVTIDEIRKEAEK